MIRLRFLAVSLTCVVATAASGSDSWAESPPPWPEFTYKRVGPPTAPSGPRITVRIDPSSPQPEPPTEPPTPAPVAAVTPDVLPHAEFWSAISPDLTDSSPARLEAAVGAADVPPPRLDELRKITDHFGRDILAATVGTRVSPAIVAAVISVESGGRSDAVSKAGAKGLMQLMPDTAVRFGVTDPLDPVDSIKGGVAYLDWLMGHFDSDPVLVLAAYNAGEGAIRDHAGVPPFPETRGYVPKVLAAWQVASGLCLTPPDLISDGCVFVGPDRR